MARTPRSRTRSSGGGDSWGRRGGKEGMSRATEERKKAAENRNSGPFRFFLNKGDAREIIILDASVDDFWYMYEHTYYNQQERPPVRQYACSREFEECPICEEAASNRNSPYGPAAWTIYLTVLELHDDDPYEDRDGNLHYESKRLMAVKATQSSDLEHIFDIVMKKEGTLRGLTLLMQRDEGKQAVRIGKPVMNDDGEMYSFWDEDELIDQFGSDEVKKDGKVVREADFLITPYNYAKLFPKPDAITLSEQTGLELAAGSDAAIRRELDEEGEEEDERPSRSRGRSSRRSGGRKAQSTTGARSRSRSRSRDEEEDDGEEEAPRRGRSRPRASRREEPEDDAPPRGRSRSRSRSRSREEEQEEEPPRRSRSRSRSREEPEEPEDDGEEEPPRRSRSRSRRASDERDASPRRGRTSRAGADLDDDEIPF